MAKRKHSRRRRSYGFADYTEDSFDLAASAVTRAKVAADCAGAETAAKKFFDMSEYAAKQSSKGAKLAKEYTRHVESELQKACRNR